MLVSNYTSDLSSLLFSIINGLFTCTLVLKRLTSPNIKFSWASVLSACFLINNYLPDTYLINSFPWHTLVLQNPKQYLYLLLFIENNSWILIFFSCLPRVFTNTIELNVLFPCATKISTCFQLCQSSSLIFSTLLLSHCYCVLYYYWKFCLVLTSPAWNIWNLI